MAWFLIQFHFVRRGREYGHDMKRADLLFSNFGKYLELKDSLTKNHRGGDDQPATKSRLHATNDANSPLKLIQSYLKHLNAEYSYLWQRQKPFFEQHGSSFCQQKICINTY